MCIKTGVECQFESHNITSISQKGKTYQRKGPKTLLYERTKKREEETEVHVLL